MTSAKVLSHKQKLIDLLGDCADARILDYGCGNGDFIELLLSHKRKPNEILAVDADENVIANIRRNFASAINSKVVVPKLACNPFELHGLKFDKIICQNVLECVDDKLDFINNFKALLNQDAIFILAHHDFDAAIYNSYYKKLSRELVHHFSDTQQAWQKHSDGQMGRKIPGLISDSVFHENAKCVTWRLIDTKFEAGTYGFLMADMLMKAGEGSFDAADMQTWYQDLVHKNEVGEYYFAIDLVVSICTLSAVY